MNVLFISNLYPPNVVGGYERLCFDMASAFAARNHRVSVLTSNYGGRVEDYSGQDVERSLRLLADERDIYRSFSASGVERKEINAHNATVLERKLAEVRPDVLFVWNLFFFDRSLLQAIQSAGCRTVFLLTDNWFILFLKPEFWYRYFTREVLSSHSRTSAIRAVFSRLLSCIHTRNLSINCHAIFPSRFMHELYVRAGFRFQESVVIPHGVRLARHREGAYRDRMYPVENGRLRLLFAGRVVEMKGVHTILEAFPEITRGLPKTEVRLTVLGDSQDRQYVERLEGMIRLLDLGGGVEFLPPIPESDLFCLFQSHDIFLFPSLYEPFSLTLIHAMASGIPVVASDVGGNKEIVFPGRTGLLFSRGEPRSLARAVLNLAGDPNLSRTVAVGARKMALEFTFQAMVQKVEAYLSET
ncbi:MAG: glycosyltransferase [Deltaproteobacteria bacterium]|nr:glycosyltransferase [Deltaproteobacteria bacterium]